MAGYTTGFLKSMAERMREMPEVEPAERIHSKQESISFLAKEISGMQKRGYTLDQISEFLRGGGMDIATPTLKSYLQRAKQKRAPTKTPTGKTKDAKPAVAPVERPKGAFMAADDTQEI